MKQQEVVRPLTLRIKRGLWDRFKRIIPRAITLNDAVVALIRDKLKELHHEINFSEKPFMAKDGEMYVVLYAGGSKGKEFERKKDAQAFLQSVRDIRG